MFDQNTQALIFLNADNYNQPVDNQTKQSGYKDWALCTMLDIPYS